MLEKTHDRTEQKEMLQTKQSVLIKPFMPLKEAVIYLGISESTMYKLTSSGKIAHYKPNGKMIFFKKEDLDAWALSNRQRTNKEIEDEAISLVKGRSVA